MMVYFMGVGFYVWVLLMSKGVFGHQRMVEPLIFTIFMAGSEQSASRHLCRYRNVLRLHLGPSDFRHPPKKPKKNTHRKRPPIPLPTQRTSESKGTLQAAHLLNSPMCHSLTRPDRSAEF